MITAMMMGESSRTISPAWVTKLARKPSPPILGSKAWLAFTLRLLIWNSARLAGSAASASAR